MKVKIMAGASGAGKTSHIKDLMTEGERIIRIPDLDVDGLEFDFYDGDVVILSADDITFDADGSFHVERLGAAHGLCIRMFGELLRLEDKDAPSKLIVDNTNTSAWEIAPYVAIAMAHQADFEILVKEERWWVCNERNIHSTPAHHVRAQARRLERTLDEWPAYWPAPKYL